MNRSPATHPFAASPEESLEIQARRRAGARLGWYVHAMVFVAVNLVLAVISASRGQAWAVFPALGWGLGLLLHGLGVWIGLGGGGLRQRLIEQERARLLRERDPW